MFVYDNEFKSNAIATCKVEVTPLTCMYTQTQAGVQNSLTLTLPVTDSKKIELFSSSPKNVYLPKRNIENKIHVIPGTTNHINIHTKTFSAEMKRVVVNALGKSLPPS